MGLVPYQGIPPLYIDNKGGIPVLSSDRSSKTESGVPNLSRSINSVACNCTAMRKASRRVSQMYDAALAPAGLKATQLAILSEIDRRADDPPTMRELADAMVMDRSTLGQNLRPLERDRLLAWKPTDADRRRKLVVLTEKGRAKRMQARSLWRAAQERFERTVGAAEAARLRGILLGIATSSELTSPE
jgi:DNA-binding MarR family transcriptional regulator